MTFRIDELVTNLLLFVLVFTLSIIITKLIGRLSKEEKIQEEDNGGD